MTISSSWPKNFGKKYELIMAHDGLYQIRALKTFGEVKAGDLGGYVQSEKNLSHEDRAADEDLGHQIEMHIAHLSDASTPEDVLYELLLKAGFPLITEVKKVKLAGKPVYSIEGGALLICLEKEITSELIDALAEANPLQVICLDEGFRGNDQLKANAVQTFRARAEAEESEIVFKTV